MTTVDFITELFCRIDDALLDGAKHTQAKLYPSEGVTLAVLYALKGAGQLAFWRWLTRDYRPLFPYLSDRTRLFRWFNSHRPYVARCLADPSLIGVIDSYGIELHHPMRAGRREQQIGKKGQSNKRWIVGGKLCFVLNHLGLIVSWACATANVYDGTAFQKLVDDWADQRIIFSDTGFEKKDWHPAHRRLCQRGEWNGCMLVETVLFMLTYICNFKHSRHKAWDYFETKVGFTMALFNILVQWHGLQPEESMAVILFTNYSFIASPDPAQWILPAFMIREPVLDTLLGVEE